MRRRQPTVRVAATAVALLAAAGCAKGGVDAAGPTTTAAPPISLADPTSSTRAPDPGGKDVAGQVFGGQGGTPGEGAGEGEGDGGGAGAAIGRLTPEASSAYLEEAGSRTSSQDTAEYTITMEVEGAADHPGTVSLFDISGAYDHGADASRATIDMSGLAAAAPEALGEDASLFADPVDTIQLGTTSYVKVPGLTDALGDGWIKTTGDDSGNPVQPLLDLFRVDDIGAFLDSLGAAGTVEEVGTEDVAGVSTTHYHSDIDPSKIDATGTQDLFGNLGDAEHAAVDVWVDDDALVHRIQIVADASALGSDLAPSFAGGEVTIVLELAGLGDAVTIEAPPDDEVLDLGAGGGLGLDEDE